MASTDRPGWRFEDGDISVQSVKGIGAIGGGRQGGQGLYEQSSTPHYPLGYRLTFDDGRVYRYAHFAGAVTPAGKLVAIDDTSQVIADGAATAVVDSAGTAKDYASTDNVSTIYLKDYDKFTAAHSDDVLAGGYFHICDNPHAVAGEGQTYRIRSNDYTATTSIMKLDLYDNLAINLGSEAQVAVTGCMYRNLVPTAGTASDSVIAGVPTVAMTAAYYGWVQTWGPCAVLADGAITAGNIVCMSDSVAGAVSEMGQLAAWSEGAAASTFDLLVSEPVIGFAISAGTTTNYVPIFLQLSP